MDYQKSYIVTHWLCTHHNLVRYAIYFSKAVAYILHSHICVVISVFNCGWTTRNHTFSVNTGSAPMVNSLIGNDKLVKIKFVWWGVVMGGGGGLPSLHGSRSWQVLVVEIFCSLMNEKYISYMLFLTVLTGKAWLLLKFRWLSCIHVFSYFFRCSHEL